jgi:hypothetical protein
VQQVGANWAATRASTVRAAAPAGVSVGTLLGVIASSIVASVAISGAVFWYFAKQQLQSVRNNADGQYVVLQRT